MCVHLITQPRRLELLPEDLRVDLFSRAVLADGITEAAFLMVYEHRFRAESQINTDWLTHQIKRFLVTLSGLRTISPRSPPHRRLIKWAWLSLGYLDFRSSGEWRTRSTDLALWLTQFLQMVPGYQLTDPQAHA
ncbi:hypothetical protein OA249_01870 [Litorivicinus sp.]|nr:hypothetical protein [Litorivicinus sp.]